MGCGASSNAKGRSITRVAPATIRNTSVEDDSVLHVSVNESGSGSKSPLKQSSGHVRSNYSKSSGSRPTSTETSRQISSRPLSRSSGRPDNGLNSSQGSASLSAKLHSQSKPMSRPHSHISRPHSRVSRSYSRTSRRPKIDQWDNSTPGEILQLSGYQGNLSQLSTCPHCDHTFTTAGLRVPLLLLCGHSYCTNCVEKACSTYPSAIKCGLCNTSTPVDQQGAAHMMQNEALLEVLDNKQLQTSIPQMKGRENCAECERQPASLYCSSCAAVFCAPCSHKSHAGSKVRGKHTPIPITQRPQPNPTCKKHPGQTCMLYCETEGVPMCVLCKFYGHHRVHKYELLSKVAAKQSGSLADKQNTLLKVERHLGNLSKQLSTAVDDITHKAHQSQQVLEDHFTDLREQVFTLLERREAELLSQLDQQVELKQGILQEHREEVAMAVAKVMACEEEAARLQGLSPIASLLAGRHLEQVFNTVTMDTYTIPHQATNQLEVPLSLIPDVTPQVVQLLRQHGAVLQLPSCPTFTDVMVTTNSIKLYWSLCDTEDVAMDTTMTYSLEYHPKVPPSSLMRHDSSSRRSRMATNSVESGFDETSTSSDYRSSQYGVSMVTMTSSGGAYKISHDPDIPEHVNNTQLPEIQPIRDVISSLLPTPVHLPTLPNKGTGELPSIVATKQLHQSKHREQFNQSEHRDSSSLLNLPPLKAATATPPVDHVSNTTSGVFAESEDSVPMETRPYGESPSSDDGSTLSTHTSNYANIGRHSNGIQFQQIYHGNDTQYMYTDPIPGACYYFRLCCHNAAGWGPYSDIIKCTVSE